MFDVVEAINDIIDDINNNAMESAKAQYEEIYETLCLRVECGDLTLEDAEAVNEAAYEKYFGESPVTEDIDEDELNEIISESIDDLIFDTDVVTEGSNMEYASIFRKGKKEFKGLMKQYKSQLKSGDFEGARGTVKLMEKTLDRMESSIRQLQSSSGSTALAIAISSIIVMAQYITVINQGRRLTTSGANLGIDADQAKFSNDAAFGFGAIGPQEYSINNNEINNAYKSANRQIITGRAISIIGGTIVACAGIGRRLKGILREYDAKDKTGSKDYFNTYKNQLLKEVGNLKKQVSKLSKAVDAAEKRQLKNKKK